MRVVGGSFTSLSHVTASDVATLVLGEPPDQAPGTTWDIFVDVLLEEAGFTRLGALRTKAVANRLAPQRVVGYAVCPGARGWRVVVGNGVASSRADVYIVAGGTSFAHAVGVYPNDPIGTLPDASAIPW